MISGVQVYQAIGTHEGHYHNGGLVGGIGLQVLMELVEDRTRLFGGDDVPIRHHDARFPLWDQGHTLADCPSSAQRRILDAVVGAEPVPGPVAEELPDRLPAVPSQKDYVRHSTPLEPLDLMPEDGFPTDGYHWLGNIVSEGAEPLPPSTCQDQRVHLRVPADESLTL